MGVARHAERPKSVPTRERWERVIEAHPIPGIARHLFVSPKSCGRFPESAHDDLSPLSHSCPPRRETQSVRGAFPRRSAGNE